MTCVDKYFEEHPNSQIVGCPHDYGYSDKPKDCYHISCFKDCWARELCEENKEVKK